MPESTPVNNADPGAGARARRDEYLEAFAHVLDSGRYILGPEVSAFEQEFARYVGVRCAVGSGSGTDALYLPLRSCGIGTGDAVFTVSLTSVATVAAIERTGATPVLVDVDPSQLTMDPSRLEDSLRSTRRLRPAAVVPVHLYGNPADLPGIADIADRHALRVVEDCAQSHGASLRGRKTGAWGCAAAFSFYPTKNLGALGDGGAVVTDDPSIAEQVCLLRQYGWRERYVSAIPGTNSRLDEVQAAILRTGLHHLDQDNTRRREIAAVYDTELAGSSLNLPQPHAQAVCVYHQYVVRHRRRDELQSWLQAHSVGTAILYPVPVHLQPAYRHRCRRGAGGLAETERACEELLCLPVHPWLEHSQVQRVCGLILAWDAQSECERDAELQSPTEFR